MSICTLYLFSERVTGTLSIGIETEERIGWGCSCSSREGRSTVLGWSHSYSGRRNSTRSSGSGSESSTVTGADLRETDCFSSQIIIISKWFDQTSWNQSQMSWINLQSPPRKPCGAASIWLTANTTRQRTIWNESSHFEFHIFAVWERRRTSFTNGRLTNLIFRMIRRCLRSRRCASGRLYDLRAILGLYIVADSFVLLFIGLCLIIDWW